MDRYSSIKEEIKGMCDIVELIGQFVQLKKTGKNYVGLCPFHSEKDPSFTVNPERQIFHCFGCKKGGDIFTFWMEYHNVSFFEALKDIAERYNIDIKGLSGDKGEERAKLLEINEMAASFYRQMLYDPVEGKKAREYLRKRNIDDAVAKEAGLGYAPDRWDSLYKLFLNRHIDIRLAINAGLLVERDAGDGCYDRFRNRLIFPIFDIRGRVVGFGGRTLGDGMPKYLN
ncbi:MAG: DNA primase, partial [Deltaproteobacteria bacterium]